MSNCQISNTKKKMNYQELFNCLVESCGCDNCKKNQIQYQSFKIIRNFIRKNLKKKKEIFRNCNTIEDHHYLNKPLWLAPYYHNLLDKTVYFNFFNIKN